jgi:hypothetical protein
VSKFCDVDESLLAANCSESLLGVINKANNLIELGRNTVKIKKFKKKPKKTKGLDEPTK